MHDVLANPLFPIIAPPLALFAVFVVALLVTVGVLYYRGAVDAVRWARESFRHTLPPIPQSHAGPRLIAAE